MDGYPIDELFMWQRPRKVIALQSIAFELGEHSRSPFVLDAFGCDVEPELLGELDDRAYDFLVPDIVEHIQYK